MVSNEIPAILALQVTWRLKGAGQVPRTWRGLYMGRTFLILVIFSMHNTRDEVRVYISYENRGQSFWVRMKNWIVCEGWTPGSPDGLLSNLLAFCVQEVVRERFWWAGGWGVWDLFPEKTANTHHYAKDHQSFPHLSSQPQKSKESKAGNPTPTQYSELMLFRGKQVVQNFQTGLKTIYPRDGSGATAEKYSYRKIRLGKRALYFP